MAIASRQPGWTAARAARLLGATRPTANDLFVGIETVRAAWAEGADPMAAADSYREKIVEDCPGDRELGAPLFSRRTRVLTHCNAGALATVEWGTALAPLRVAHDRGMDIFVWVDETRPLLQGSRLTAWELAQEGIPHAVIVDNAAGYFMQKGDIDAVIVGADRIARNGDVANKIGTYEKAVVAQENGIPFYVAAPFSTFDPKMASGSGIPIEERGDEEVRVMGTADSPARSEVRNPAFDVTPSKYVTAFVTPVGVISPDRVQDLGSRTSTRRLPRPQRPSSGNDPRARRPGSTTNARHRSAYSRGSRPRRRPCGRGARLPHRSGPPP